MNSIVALLAVSAIFAVVSASGYSGGSSSGGSYSAPVSIPAPPCPKNYLFSCQPNLAPAPCSPSGGGYGSSGAYSDNIPSIANAPYHGAPYQGYPNFQHQFPNFYGQPGSNNN